MIRAGKRLTGNGLVHTGPGSIDSVLLTAGTDAAKLIIYDNIKAVLETTVEWAPRGHVFSKGAYGALTGTTPEAVIVYT
jgi:hypothetical protein